MKKILLSSLIAAAAAVPAFAGVDNINYQAVIKDGSSVVADKEVSLKFELLDKSAEVVYSEEQTPKTNAAGYVSCQLGKDDALSTIDWGDLTLRVSINLGNGYQVISNEAVSSVPTALYALRSADSDEIKEAVEELMLDTELNKETILGINAEIVRLSGITEDLPETYATLEQVDAFATMNETRLDKMQNQMDETDKKAEEDYMDIKGSIFRIEQNLGALQGKQNEDLDALNEQIDAFATMNETRLDKMQNQMDETDKTVEENYDDLKGSIMRNEQNISALQGKVNENLENYQEDWQALAKFQDEISTAVNELTAQYAEDWQSLSKFQEEISTDINEFKNQYAEDWQSLTKFQEEISTDINEFKAQYAEDWQSLTKFQEEISTDINEFKSEYQESFQKMAEFQEGASTSISELNTKVGQLEDAVKMIVDPQDPESIINAMSEKMAEMEEELMNKIAALEDVVNALKEEVEALKGK